MGRWASSPLYLFVRYVLLTLSFFLKGSDVYGQTATGGDCVTFFPSDAEVLNYCKNGAKCGVNLISGVMLQLVCDCESLQTTEVFYGGPDCSVKGKMNYLTGSLGSDVPNTCWLENILGLNAWKDVAARVSSFCYQVPCPSPDGSS